MSSSYKSYIRKYLVMKPEVQKIFNDLDEYLNYCRFNLLKYDPKDLYKSNQYREFLRKTKNPVNAQS
jgi:hypothetical protein